MTKAPHWNSGKTQARSEPSKRQGRECIKPGSALAPREAELLRFMCASNGEGLKRPAAAMGVNRNTLSEYVKRMKIRTGARNVYQLGVWARDNGYAESIVQPRNGSIASVAAMNQAEQQGSAA